MAGTKVYVGGGWTGKYGLNISLNLEKLKGLRTDKYGNVRLAVGQRREVDEKSKQTHYVAEDDYYWSKQGGGDRVENVPDGDGLPF